MKKGIFGVLSIVIVFMFIYGYCGEVKIDEKTRDVCNQVMLNIYDDIIGIKDKYKELDNFGEESLVKDDLYRIYYDENDNKGFKKRGNDVFFVFSISIVNINETYQIKNRYEKLRYPDLGIKIYGFCRDINKPELVRDIVNIVYQNVKLIEEIRTKPLPPEVVRLLLGAIGDKAWEKTTECLSANFLKKHKKEILAGEYFKSSRRKDRTVFYKSSARVSEYWKIEENGKVAIVTLNIVDPKAIGLLGINEVKLIKENDQWKVDEF